MDAVTASVLFLVDAVKFIVASHSKTLWPALNLLKYTTITVKYTTVPCLYLERSGFSTPSPIAQSRALSQMSFVSF